VLVVGKGADNIPMQAGGWSITWQGTDTTNADFPNADSVLAGVRDAVGQENVVYSADGSAAARGGFDVVLAVVGETPYAEYNGDIAISDTVSHTRQYPEDLAVLQRVAAAGKPVVTVFLSGRPRYTNDLMNLSQVFVAAWLPGTEGKGVTDVLFAKRGGGVAHEFRGALGFPWPAVACPDAQTAPLFAVGHGLRHGTASRLGTLPVDATAACAEASVLPVFNMADIPPFNLHVAAGEASRPVGADLNRSFEFPVGKPALRVQTVQVNTQQDAKQVTWLAPGRLYAANPARNNLIALGRSDAAVQFDVVVHHRPKAPVLLSMGCGAGCGADVDLTATLSGYTPGARHTVKVPLACFADRGLNLGGVEVPFSVSATAPFSAAFTDIKVVAGAAKDADAVACPVGAATP
jgi:beta-glucosidase